jgi:hypothetical protein
MQVTTLKLQGAEHKKDDEELELDSADDETLVGHEDADDEEDYDCDDAGDEEDEEDEDDEDEDVYYSDYGSDYDSDYNSDYDSDFVSFDDADEYCTSCACERISIANP